MNTLEQDLKKVYGNKPLRQNMYYLYQQFPWIHQCDFSKRTYNIITNPQYTTKELESLFLVNPELVKNISSSDRKNLACIYFYKNLSQVFSKEEYHYVSKRNYPRFQVNMEVRIELSSYKVLEVSELGFCMIGESDSGEAHGKIFVSDEVYCLFSAVKCWSHNGRTGFKINEISGVHWEQMIRFSESLLTKSLKNGLNHMA